MITPAPSTVSGKVLSSNTRAGYAADWALFTDWCAATNHTALPADWSTGTAFTAAFPGAPATTRRRLAAVTHHHSAADQPPPTDPDSTAGPPLRELIDPGQVDMLMRLLPSHGWTAGLFGRRDRALLTLAAATTIPYRQRARLTVAQLHIADGIATITDHHGTAHVVESAADPLLCGPCALVRWRRALDTEATFKSLKNLLKHAEVVTAASHYPCRNPKPIDQRTLEAPLFPPINQWGHLPLPIRPLSPHSTSRLAQQADTGLAHHKALRVDKFIAALDSTQPTPESAPRCGTGPPRIDGRRTRSANCNRLPRCSTTSRPGSTRSWPAPPRSNTTLSISAAHRGVTMKTQADGRFRWQLGSPGQMSL